jgi:Tol biopolymer transport system component
MRALILAAVAGFAAIALYVSGRPWSVGDAPAALTFVATANQLGVVGYRDPVGQLSADGRWVAYSEGRYVRVVPVAGGTSPTLPPSEGQVRWLSWLDAGRVIAEDTGSATHWWVYDLQQGSRTPLWAPAAAAAAATNTAPRLNDLRQLVASADGAWLAATTAGTDGPQLWRVAVDGARAERPPQGPRPSSPAWMPSGQIACLVRVDGRTRIAAPCEAEPLEPMPDVEAVGPIAFSPDGARVYFASPNTAGFVDLWQIDRASRRASRLTGFSRDSYGPSVAQDGTVLFRVQSYRTHVAELRDGRTRQLTTFQAETPWWHPRDPLLSLTFGTWRRVIDDAKYPDIAQELGVIDADRGLADQPLQIVARSDSEDQAMAWSPNGRWIALHSHREQSDDVWLRPADGSAPDRRITMLGRGAEVGWPRWSPDGQTVLLDGANRQGRSVAYVIGVSQQTGEVTAPLAEVSLTGVDGDVMHAEWMPDGQRIAAIVREGPGRHAIVLAARGGGAATVAHRVESEHDFPGLTVSPDGRWLGFVAPARDGYYQVFRVAATGGAPEQLTRDPSHKTQPARSPDGTRLAFTMWSYTSTFWTFHP